MGEALNKGEKKAVERALPSTHLRILKTAFSAVLTQTAETSLSAVRWGAGGFGGRGWE